MPDPREAVMRLVAQDMKRVLRAARREKDSAERLTALVQVSHQQWNLFYPPLALIPDEEPITIVSVWNRRPSNDNPWELECWYATSLDGRRCTTLAVSPFGEAGSVAVIEPIAEPVISVGSE